MQLEQPIWSSPLHSIPLQFVERHTDTLKRVLHESKWFVDVITFQPFFLHWNS